MQYHVLLHDRLARGIFMHDLKPKASENVAHGYNNHDMHANECNKMFTTTVPCRRTKNQVTRCSNAPVLIKAHHGC